MGAIPIQVGDRFGKLVVVAEAEKHQGARCFKCQCDCGGFRISLATRLKSGMNKSCGCLKPWKSNPRGNPKLTRLTHGDRGAREYITWCHIISRCENPRNNRFGHYGGRGIKVCRRWRESYEAFLADMGRKPSRDHSIDRIDVDGDYEPGNCRWATRIEQAGNTRKKKAA